MAYVNGAASKEAAPPAAIPVLGIGEHGQAVQVSPERLQNIRELLNEPFDPARSSGA